LPDPASALAAEASAAAADSRAGLAACAALSPAPLLPSAASSF